LPNGEEKKAVNWQLDFCGQIAKKAKRRFMKSRRFPFFGRLNKVRPFCGTRRRLGGRCRVLFLLLFQRVQRAAMEA